MTSSRKRDWRSDITGFDSLDDLDPIEVMVFQRHQFLSCAKDLMYDDPTFADNQLIAALCLQEAIECQLPHDLIITLVPAHITR